MKKQLKSVIAISVICAVVSVLMAVTNFITAPVIEEQQKAAANEALLVVMPEGKEFTSVDLAAYTLPESINEAYSEASGGYVFKMTVTGYSPNMVIMCGVDAAGAVTGATCIASGETLGEEATYGEKLVGATAQTVESVDTVAGATRTTEAYRNAVRDALNAQVILGGGSVDLRSEEEILADTLNEVLPAGEGAFTAVFLTEEVENISAVYAADNGTGYVLLTGETYVATDSTGKVITVADEAIKTTVETAAQKIINSSLTEIDLGGYTEMPTQVQKAYKTTSGNYLFELRAAGFGINGDQWYNPSGEYIYLRVSATAEGKIIACETISQKETDGIGSACADASFYTQFNGKDAETYKEIDAISGATITTNGYKTAVSKVFEAINILKGAA